MSNRTDAERKKRSASHRIARYPAWYRIARHVRSSQLPKEFKIVFDIESDPIYQVNSRPEKVAIANEILPGRVPEGVPYEQMTEQLYEDGIVYIKSNNQLREACSIIYRNLVVSDVMKKNIDKMVEKAAAHDDPNRLLAIVREMRATNRDYSFMHANRLAGIAKKSEKKEEPKKPEVNIPSYWKKKEAKSENS